MIPELGQVALLLALAVALILGTLPMVGAARGRADWMALARPAARAHALLVAVAFFCLVACFVRNDFSVLYVASNSNTLAAAAVPHRRRLGRPRRLAAAVAGDAGRVDAGGGAVEPQAAARRSSRACWASWGWSRSASSCSC